MIDVFELLNDFKVWIGQAFVLIVNALLHVVQFLDLWNWTVDGADWSFNFWSSFETLNGDYFRILLNDVFSDLILGFICLERWYPGHLIVLGVEYLWLSLQSIKTPCHIGILRFKFLINHSIISNFQIISINGSILPRYRNNLIVVNLITISYILAPKYFFFLPEWLDSISQWNGHVVWWWLISSIQLSNAERINFQLLRVLIWH